MSSGVAWGDGCHDDEPSSLEEEDAIRKLLFALLLLWRGWVVLCRGGRVLCVNRLVIVNSGGRRNIAFRLMLLLEFVWRF